MSRCFSFRCFSFSCPFPRLFLLRFCCLVAACAAATLSSPPATAAGMQFRVHPIVDEQLGGMVFATISVPVQWKVTGQVRWTWADASAPMRSWARVESPDGSAWIEFFPAEVFYWLQPVRSPVPIGRRSLGMIHAPGVGLQDAMNNFVIGPYRGRMQNLQRVDQQPVDPARLASAFSQPPTPGEAMRVRLRYTLNGRPVDEDVYGMLGAGNRVPYTGPQGTWYESHRPLWFAHAYGATDGQLSQVYPLLTYIVSTLRLDPMWQARREQVQQQINDEFNRNIARGYAQIQAAAQMSRTISANNDAMLASMQAQRQIQAQRDAAMRAASQTASGNGFSDYLRGTTRMRDPYWGESAQSSAHSYHWTDGQGNYRASNDPTFNPNIGGGGGPNWTRMDAIR